MNNSLIKYIVQKLDMKNNMPNTHKDIINVGWAISYHLPRFKSTIDAPVNTVIQVVEKDPES